MVAGNGAGPARAPGGSHADRQSRLFSDRIVLLLRPLIAAGLVPAGLHVSMHAVSGYSGGGKALIEVFEAGAVLAPMSSFQP